MSGGLIGGNHIAPAFGIPGLQGNETIIWKFDTIYNSPQSFNKSRHVAINIVTSSSPLILCIR